MEVAGAPAAHRLASSPLPIYTLYKGGHNPLFTPHHLPAPTRAHRDRSAAAAGAHRRSPDLAVDLLPCPSFRGSKAPGEIPTLSSFFWYFSRAKWWPGGRLWLTASAPPLGAGRPPPLAAPPPATAAPSRPIVNRRSRSRLAPSQTKTVTVN
jgi:hypothetical protein